MDAQTASSARPEATIDVAPAADAPSGLPAPVTARTLRRMTAEGQRIPCLTCYDATTARWLQRAGVPVLLVGDTAAEVILGLPSTIHAPLDFLLQLTAAVKRGAPHAFVVGDMPFLSYQCDAAEAVRNAGRFLVEGSADAVKLEVDRSFARLVGRMARAGIPVIAHLGCRPQHAKRQGGYVAAGRSAAEGLQLVEDAVLFERRGAIMLLMEAVPDEIAAEVVRRVRIPVIGCGAGPSCHGQIVVLHDLLGQTDWQPSFARPIAQHGSALLAAAADWCRRVSRNDLGEHPYRMSPEERAAFIAQAAEARP